MARLNFKSLTTMPLVVLTLTSTIACTKSGIPTSSPAPLSAGGHTTLPFQQWFEAFSTCHLMLVSGTTKPFETIQRYFPISDSKNPLPVTLFRTSSFARGKEIPIWNLTFTGYCYATLILELNSTDCDTNQGIAQLRTSRQLFIGDKYYQHLVTTTGQFPQAIGTEQCPVKADAAHTIFALDLTRRGALHLSPDASDPGLFEIHSLQVPCDNCIDPVKSKSHFKAADYTSFTNLIETAEIRRQSLLPQIPTVFTGAPIDLNPTGRPFATVFKNMLQKFGNQTLVLPATESDSYFRERLSLKPALFDDFEEVTSFLIWDEKYFNFLTCHVNLPGSSLLHLIAPFETLVWVAFIVTVAIFLFVFVKLASAVKSKWFYAIMIIYSQAVGSSVPLRPQFEKGLAKLFLSLFLLLSLIFNNVYRSCITSDVTAPNPIQRLETLADLKDFTLYSGSPFDYTISQSFDKIMSKNATVKQQGVETVISYLEKKFPHIHPYSTKVKVGMMTEIGIEIALEEQSIHSLKSRSSGQDLAVLERKQEFLLSLLNQMEPMMEIPIRKLQKCNKTALVVSTQALFFSMDEEGDEGKPKLYKGKERFLWKPYRLVSYSDRVNGRFAFLMMARGLVENGVYSWMTKTATIFWLEAKYGTVALDDDRLDRGKADGKKSAPAPISMQSVLIWSTFVIFAVMVSVSVVAFVAETSFFFIVARVREKKNNAPTPTVVIQVQQCW